MKWLWVAYVWYIVMITFSGIGANTVARLKGIKLPWWLTLLEAILYPAFFAWGIYNIFK